MEVNCDFGYSGNLEPSVVCSPGPDADIVPPRKPTQNLITYRKRMLRREGDIKNTKCTLTVAHIPGFIDVPLLPLVSGGKITDDDVH
jgi:hypothetical protein